MSKGSFKKFFRWIYRNRSISLTPEGTRFVLLVFAIGLAAINTGNNLLYLLLAMMLSLIVLSGILSERCLKHLTIHRQTPQHIYAGRPTTAYFSIVNGKTRHPSFSLRIMDVIQDRLLDRGIHILHLGPGLSTLQPYSLLIPKRGLVRVQAVKIFTRFPFSLFVKGLTIPLESELVVYPEIKPIPPHLDNDLLATGHDRSRPRRGYGGDLYNLRTYQPGDDSRSIHWRTTARTNVLVVRELEAEERQEITILLPTYAPQAIWETLNQSQDQAALFEDAVKLTASFVVHFKKKGFAIRALIGNHLIPMGTGESHQYEILHALALCQPEQQPTTDPTSIPHDNLDEVSQGESFTLLVLPWNDSRFERAFNGHGKILRVWEFTEPTHDT